MCNVTYHSTAVFEYEIVNDRVTRLNQRFFGGLIILVMCTFIS